MPLCERVFNCQKCGVSIDRDLNAAINLLQAPDDKIGRATTESNACGEEGADSPVPKRDRYAPQKQEVDGIVRLCRGMCKFYVAESHTRHAKASLF